MDNREALLCYMNKTPSQVLGKCLRTIVLDEECLTKIFIDFYKEAIFDIERVKVLINV